MHLILLLELERLNRTELEFFQEAYYWRFGKALNSDSDVVQYMLHAIIPPYVVGYIQHLGEHNAL